MICGKIGTVAIVDEFSFEPTVKRISTFYQESKIFRETMYYANPIMYSYEELAKMRDWCWEAFGAPGFDIDTMKTTWDYNTDPDVIFWFSDEKNLMFFILRWS